MIVRGGLTLLLVVCFSAVALAQGAPKQGGEQRGGARPMPPQGGLRGAPQGRFGEGFRGPLGPRGGEEGARPEAIGEQVLREHLTATFDANANGQLEREECDAAIAAIRDRQLLAARGVAPALTEQDVVQLFDADGNGQLNGAEFQGAVRGIDAVLGEGASQRIAQKNGQGGQDGAGPRGDGGPRFGDGGGRPKGPFGRGGSGGRGGPRGR